MLDVCVISPALGPIPSKAAARPQDGEALGRRAQVKRILKASLFAFAVLAASKAQAVVYRIEAGDVLEFSVASLPGLKQRTAVDIDGDINFPLLQNIHAAGLPLTLLRDKVRELISAKPFRQRGPEGAETLMTIDPDEITISLVEYRPVYINGDVGRPGEQPFRPGMTVRQLVALGGGYDPALLKTTNPALQIADLRSDYQTFWTSLLGERATIKRLQSELEARDSFEEAVAKVAPIPLDVQRGITQRENAELASKVRDYNNEKVFLNKSVDQANQFLSVLTDQQANEKQGTDLDQQDLDRVNQLFSKGAVPITRVLDARRALLLSSTRQLQTSVQVSENQIRREGLLRSLDKLDDERRADLLADLQKASLSALDDQARLQAVSQKLAFLGRAAVGAGSDPDVTLQIHRKDAPALTATDDTELQPGDVVQVKLKADLFTAAE